MDKSNSGSHKLHETKINVDPAKLQPGDWILMEYGLSVSPWYVLDVLPHGALLGNPDWLVGAALFFPNGKLKNTTYIGRGKRRRWYRFFRIGGLVMPFSKPKELWW